MSEQKRIAKELDRRVAERTGELAEANEALKQELVVERQRTEAARRANDLDARVIAASMPGMVSILTPAGGIDAVNDEVVEVPPKHEIHGWCARHRGAGGVHAQ